MIIWVRNIVFILFILTIIYVVLSTVSRIRKGQKLKIEYEAQDIETDEADYIAKGMQKYERSLKPKLFIGVYLIPLIIAVGLIYLAQT